MNQSIEYKLIGTSDLKAARRIGERVTLIEFTGGNSRAIVETEARSLKQRRARDQLY